MNKIISTISVFLLISLCGFVNTGEWVKFETKTSRIFFPTTPKDDSTIVESTIGKLTLYTHMLELDESSPDSNMVYGLIETEYPQQYFKNTGQSFLKGFFEGAIGGAVKNVNGKLISQKDIALKDVPGKEIKIDYGNGTAVFTMRLYLKDTRLFAVQTIALTGKQNNLNSARFFNSFKIK